MNPFYSHELGDLFPVNPLFVEWNRLFLIGQQSLLRHGSDWVRLALDLALWALPAVAGLGLLLWTRSLGWRRSALFVSLCGGLWFASVPQTTGGLFASLLLLSPALALLVVSAGIGLRETLPRSLPRWGLVLFIGLFLESWPKTLVVPENPYQLAPAGWLAASRQPNGAVRPGLDELRARLAALPPGGGIVSDNAALCRLGAETGHPVSPLWTPEFAWFFDRTQTPESISRHLQESHIRYLFVGQTGPTLQYLQEHGHWTNPRYALKVVGLTPTHFLLEFAPRNVTAP